MPKTWEEIYGKRNPQAERERVNRTVDTWQAKRKAKKVAAKSSVKPKSYTSRFGEGMKNLIGILTGESKLYDVLGKKKK
jgi:hypothetical protein